MNLNGAADAPNETAQPPDGGVPPLFVRIETLPTPIARRARAAIRLKLPQLSPASVAEIDWDIVPLETLPDGKTQWAVAFARRADLERAAADAPGSVVEVDWPMQDKTLTFRFRSRSLSSARRTAWISAAPAVTVFLLVMALFLGAVDWRLRHMTRIADEQTAIARQAATVLQQSARDRRDAVRDWRTASENPATGMMKCAVRIVAEAWPGRHEVAGLEIGPGSVLLTYPTWSPSLDALNRTTGVAVARDGTAETPRTLVRFSANACGAGR